LIKLIFICIQSIFAFATVNSILNSEAASVLGKYPSGIKVVNSLKPGGAFADIPVKFASTQVIEEKAGHDGGGVDQDPVTQKYSIILSGALTNEQKAHALAHELQHVRDEKDFDAYLKNHADLNAIGPEVIAALRSPDASKYIKQNKAKVDFVIKGLFCQELRAYSVNQQLDKEGLKFSNVDAISDLNNFISDHYLKLMGVTYSTQDLSETARACKSRQHFSDFMASIAPGTKSPQGKSSAK
jgi:hypothetical protein